jgi:hypothetical protein
MHVQRDSSYACNRFRDRWAKQDMVHEMSVYDVEMKPVGTRFFYPCALRTKMGEIRCQN